MEVLQLIVSLPKWLILLIPRCLIAVLNVIPCPWARVCVNKDFLDYKEKLGQEHPVNYIIQMTETMQLGHWLVAYLRGYYKKQILFHVRELDAGPMNSFKKLETSSEERRAVNRNRIDEIVSECKILSK